MSESLWLLIYGGLLLLARQIFLQISDILFRFFVSSIEISEREAPEIYRWFTEWLAMQPFSSSFLKLQVAVGSEQGGIAAKLQKKLIKRGLQGAPSKKKQASILFFPGFGTHLFTYEGIWIVCVFSREKEGLLSSSGSGVANRTIHLWAKSNAVGILKQLLEEARDRAHEQENQEVGVFMPDPRSLIWRRALAISKIPFGAVVLKKGVAEMIMQDCRDFLTSKDWYSQLGIPYRRGYLLYGPPGSGKSSFVHALASELGLDVHVVSIAGSQISDQGLQMLLNNASTSSILLLEDVDVLFPDREKEEQAESRSIFSGSSKTSNVLTMSGLLNALDGISGQQGRMVFMTTNFFERLDEALIRSGRVDLKQLIGYPDEDQMVRIFLKFFPEERDLAASFASSLSKLGQISMADLQGYLLKNKDDAAQAGNGAVEYFASIKKAKAL